MNRRFRVCTWWLGFLSVAAILFGISPAVAPGIMGRLFGGLYLSDPDGIAALGAEAAGYVAFVTAVMGSVLAGWATAILVVLGLRFRPGNPDAWWMIALSLLVWFIPDTGYSLWAGYWQNAVLNTVALGLFAVPLAFTFQASRGAHRARGSS